MRDLFLEMWEAQRDQQRELGLDPEAMPDVERRAAGNDFVSTLYEEMGELQRAAGRHKRHILDEAPVDSGNVAVGVASVLKMVLCIAQLHGLDPESVAEAFKNETAVVRAKAAAARVRLADHTHVLGVDLDDVTFDLEVWRQGLRDLELGPNAAENMQREEAWKDDFYKSGRFRDVAPIPGAPEALRHIQGLGVKLAFITARPQWQYKRIYADTLYSLNRFAIPHDLLLFNKDKVEAIHTHLSPAWPLAFVDDQERNARQLASAGIDVLLFDRGHNKHVSGVDARRVFSWDEIVAYVEHKLRAA